MPKGSARSATAVPMPPKPNSANVVPSSVPSGLGGKFHRSGASVTHASGRRFSNASMQASTHSEMGTALEAAPSS